MDERYRAILKWAAIGTLLVAVVIVVVMRIGRTSRVGEEGLTVWYYDLSEQRLYETPRDTIPPHRGVGGEGGDGVRAVVVACRADKDDESKRRIAYLETYTSELQGLLERARAAREAGRAFDEPIPARDSDYFQRNTLVRRVNEDAWHDMTDAEALKIMAEWRGWKCEDGQTPVVCVP